MALAMVPRNQAPVRNHTARGSSAPRCGVKMRTSPAKSMAQKAMARIDAHRTPAKRTSPSRLVSAYWVVSKLKISNAMRATPSRTAMTILREMAPPWPVN